MDPGGERRWFLMYYRGSVARQPVRCLTTSRVVEVSQGFDVMG